MDSDPSEGKDPKSNDSRKDLLFLYFDLFCSFLRFVVVVVVVFSLLCYSCQFY